MTPGKEPDHQGARPYWEIDKEGKPVPQDHHIVPKSRSGDHSRENILTGVPSDAHWAWHKLFGNLKPYEVLIILFRYFFRGGRFYKRYQRIVVKKGGRAPFMPPEDMIITLVEEVFPQDWIPPEELINYLQNKRSNSKDKS